MVGLLTFLACADVLHTEMGDERVRGAVWVEGLYANVPDYSALVVANSPLPCEPSVLIDDPATDVDEEASALSWWHAELSSAFTREGAVVLWVWVPEGLREREADLGPGEPGGWGFRWRVEEAELVSRSGAVSTWGPTEWEVGYDDTGEASFVRDGGDVVADVQLGDWSGTWRAERCDQPELASVLQSTVISVSALASR